MEAKRREEVASNISNGSSRPFLYYCFRLCFSSRELVFEIAAVAFDVPRSSSSFLLANYKKDERNLCSVSLCLSVLVSVIELQLKKYRLFSA